MDRLQGPPHGKPSAVVRVMAAAAFSLLQPPVGVPGSQPFLPVAMDSAARGEQWRCGWVPGAILSLHGPKGCRSMGLDCWGNGQPLMGGAAVTSQRGPATALPRPWCAFGGPKSRGKTKGRLSLLNTVVSFCSPCQRGFWAVHDPPAGYDGGGATGKCNTLAVADF